MYFERYIASTIFWLIKEILLSVFVKYLEYISYAIHIDRVQIKYYFCTFSILIEKFIKTFAIVLGRTHRSYWEIDNIEEDAEKGTPLKKYNINGEI